MRERITFVHDGEDAFDPQQLNLSKDSLFVRSVKAAREQRLTFGYDELPQELWQVLKQCHELHLRWATERPYDAVPPFASRVSPGLHAFYTPASKDRTVSGLCPLLRKVFGDDLNCSLPEVSFIPSPAVSTNSASTPSLQFHQLLPSLQHLVTYIREKICSRADAECQDQADLLGSADTLDLDYDSASYTLTVKAYWSKPPQQEGWVETISKNQKAAHKVEVGILALEKVTDPAELSLGGFLAVVGEDTFLKPTLFSFPSRHHPLPVASEYTTTFTEPTGLHPTLRISVPRSSLSRPAAVPDSSCALHTYLTLPSTIFADKYQLSTTDTLFLQSHNLAGLRSIVGETDLEAPDWITERWGSNLLLELATPSQGSKSKASGAGDDWEVTVPLHLRYLHPSASGYRNISIPWPVVFWACTAEGNIEMGGNPFDRVDLGWDGLFDPRTIFYQLHPNQTHGLRLVEEVKVPVLGIDETGDRSASRNIGLVTVAVVVLGFAWVLWKLGLVVRMSGVGRNKPSTVVQGSNRKSKKDQ